MIILIIFQRSDTWSKGDEDRYNNSNSNCRLYWTRHYMNEPSVARGIDRQRSFLFTFFQVFVAFFRDIKYGVQTEGRRWCHGSTYWRLYTKRTLILAGVLLGPTCLGIGRRIRYSVFVFCRYVLCTTPNVLACGVIHMHFFDSMSIMRLAWLLGLEYLNLETWERRLPCRSALVRPEFTAWFL